MAQTGGYREELEIEGKHTDPNSHASRLIAQEIERLKKGEDEVPEKKGTVAPFLDLHTERQQKVAVKIRLPIKDFPKYNFVGKLLGPKGTTLKALQEQTGCRMAIMGRGSMRDQNKEEELRKEGGKYAHLEEELHVLVECFAELTDGYHRLGAAFEELKKFIIPQMQGEFDGGEMGMNGSGRGRGSFRGGPPERGGRGGSFRGGRGAGPPPSSGRGGPGGPPSSRGGPRGAPRGGAPPPSRGGGRGAAPPSNSSYEGYGSHSQGGYNSGGYDSGYDAYGAQNYSSGGDSQYYDYGPSSGQGSGYDNYSGGYDYGDSWNTGSGKPVAPSGRGSSRGGQTRSHPYQRS